MENTNNTLEEKTIDKWKSVGRLLDLLFVPSSLVRFVKRTGDPGVSKKIDYTVALLCETLRLAAYYENIAKHLYEFFE